MTTEKRNPTCTCTTCKCGKKTRSEGNDMTLKNDQPTVKRKPDPGQVAS